MVSLRSIQVKRTHPEVCPGVQDQKSAIKAPKMLEYSDAIAMSGEILASDH